MKSRMKDTLLLIGDASSDRSELYAIFEADYYLLEAETAAQGTLLLRQNSNCIAAVLADVPLSEEAEIRELIEAGKPDMVGEIPVILLVTQSELGQHEELAFMLGAADVEKKPYAKLSVQRRVQVLVDLYRHRWHLEDLVKEQNQSIRNTYQTILDTMSSMIERRSMECGNHVLRIRGLARILLEEVAKGCPEYGLTEETIDIISAATSLHDIGKVVIPDAILNKPGPLTKAEFEIMKTHATQGSEFIAELSGAGETAYLHYAYNICLYHHERWDGKGYPIGLVGDQIPICAQVAGIMDAFDALTTPRVYKPAIPYEMAINMILNGECGAFSPKLLECLKRSHPKLAQLATQYADGKNPRADEIRMPLPGPQQMNYTLDAAQVSQLKYQVLLHYMNDAVVELDLNNRMYHVVHNPGPNVLQITEDSKEGDALGGLFLAGIHPEDVKKLKDKQESLFKMLFEGSQRKSTLYWRIYNPFRDAYDPYQITLLRVNTNNPSQRIAIAVFHNRNTDTDNAGEQMVQFAKKQSAFSLRSTVLNCRMDENLTIQEGGNTLMQLTGYAPEEIQIRFDNSLRKLVYPVDWEIIETLIKKHKRGDRIQQRQFRIFHKNNATIWVLAKCSVQTEVDDSTSLYISLTDISYVRSARREDTREQRLGKMVGEHFDDVLLEWDLARDEAFISKQWKARFGFKMKTKDFSKTLMTSSRIHPDDAQGLQMAIKQLREQETKAIVDLRMADNDGKYSWSRIRLISQVEGGEKPARIVAIMHDINDLKRNALTMKERAEQDTLTKLLNKVSTQQAATEYLEGKEKDALAALLILDVDNFKTVNDTFGHLYGDAILSQIGTNLRNLFRSKDVVGRIGGDEFLILLKDLPNTAIVNERCQMLVSIFREQLNKLMPDLPVSVSVGCAVAPKHGNSWGELFRHADEALYHAKNLGKCQYKIYNTYDTYHAALETTCHTQIDSDQQPTIDENTLVRHVFHNLYSSPNLKFAVSEVLAFVGSYFDVSRVYIFENNPDNLTCSNTFEWCNVDVEPQKENLQCVSYEKDVPGWKGCFNENGVLYSTDVRELPDDLRSTLEPQGVKSILHCAIMDQGVFRGVIGFDECRDNRLWTQKQISLLQFLAEVLSVFLLKRRKDD